MTPEGEEKVALSQTSVNLFVAEVLVLLSCNSKIRYRETTVEGVGEVCVVVTRKATNGMLHSHGAFIDLVLRRQSAGGLCVLQCCYFHLPIQQLSDGAVMVQ